MDAEIAKQSQRFLQKQGMKFKLNTKVTKGDVQADGIKINVEAAKGGKEELVSELTIFATVETKKSLVGCRRRFSSDRSQTIHHKSKPRIHRCRN
jgi:NADH dehydrogenase FAD-containing subunit